jgi:tetratricopeptide (TPR) repeat protein
MIKYILVILSFFSLVIFSQTNDKDELTDFAIAKTLLDLEVCEKSYSSFNELIRKYPKSERIEDFYYFLDRALYCKKSKQVEINSDSGSSSKTYPGKGIVAITFYSTDSLITKIDSQRIDIAEKYLTRFIKGKHKLYFEDLLLWSYPRKNNQKYVKLLERLKYSSEYDLKFFSHLFLATLLFSEESYNEAIHLYSELIKFCERDGDKSIYQLYLSNCYYNLGDYDKAIEELNKVYIIEKNFEEKYMSKMADIWMPFYKGMNEDPNKEKKQLMFIN